MALVAALAAGDATHAQEGADSTANRTKQALVELLSELPPGFDSARRVIEWDITLATDGDLSDSDILTIEGHMSKLATVIPESARKVREAMTGVETIVAADEVAALNESDEERKIRLDKEKQTETLQKMITKLNKDGLFDESAWGSTNSKWANCTIRVTRDTVSTEFINRQITWSNPKSTAFLTLGLLPGRNYTITIGKITGETSTVGIKLRDEKDQLTPLIKLNQWVNNITIPAGYQIQQILEIVNTATGPTTTIEGITLDYNWETGNQLADAK